MVEKEKKPNKVLRRERELRGWSQQSLAEQLGTNEQVVNRWESGHHKPNRHFQTQLCQLFAKSAEELGFMSEPQKRQEKNLSDIENPVNTADDFLDRFASVLKKPSNIDNATLAYLERHTVTYWQDRHGAVLASEDLLSYVLEHFDRTLALLENPLLPSVRTRLCSDTSEIAQLIGHLLFDIGDCVKARNYHKAAIRAAQEANNLALEAVAWTRMSFTWMYSKEPQKALRCILNAHLLAGNVNDTVRTYLTAVEAEIQAMLGNSHACFEALNKAENFEEHQYPNGETYWLQFDHSRLAGYKGSCYKRLYASTNQDNSLLEKSQEALLDALKRLSLTKVQRRPVLLIDLAAVYAKQGLVEEACHSAIHAMTITTQLKSHTVLQRFLLLQRELSPWQNTPYMKDLHNRISSLSLSKKDLELES